ncbi:MAG: hypothetical protein KAY32_04800 [Candidatus Eisenbacteria sp.]|nr:hypothetical protein [Candidatus Eisenbacteria bacterium]
MSTPIKQTAMWALLAAGILALGPAAAPAGAIDLDEILRLERAGVSEETILKVVEVDQAFFYLSVDDIIDLKDAGASEWFIRELMETPERFGATAEADYYYDVDPAWNEAYDDSDLYADYVSIGIDDYETVFVHHYYDPFAYHWYPWPRLYVYYSPFWWSHSGFYYAGHWSRDWWDPWNPCYRYCDYRYGWRRHFGPSHTREHSGRSWHSIDRRATRERDGRQRAVLHQAGLTQPRARVIDRSRLLSDTHRQTRARPVGARNLERPAYRGSSERSNRLVRAPVRTGERAASRSRIVRRAPETREQRAPRSEYRGAERSRAATRARSPRATTVTRSPRQPSAPRATAPPASSSRSSSSNSGTKQDPPPSRRR